MSSDSLGSKIYKLAEELFPICRSITGDGVRETLSILQSHLSSLVVHEVPSGTECFDWTVPPEWNIRDAYIVTPNGQKICDFRSSNLHVLNYAVPVDKTVNLAELQEHLYSLPDQPDAIPYVVSYYAERWGFCLSHDQREDLEEGSYQVFIDSTLAPGSLTYGELVIPGESAEEVFLSTDICHPSLGNNEISGPVVACYIAKWLLGLDRRHYTYRLIFIPETIGSLTYLSRNMEHLKRHVVAGFNVVCVGDDRTYSYLPTRTGDTLADRVALHVLQHHAPSFIRYSYLDRGSDERQYCSPGVDLPVASVMRSKYDEYPEYHTSKDDLTLISPAGLYGGYEALRRCLECLERNETLKVTVLGEPQLGRRGLYPTVSTKDTFAVVQRTLNVLAYCDGTQDLMAVAETIGEPIWELLETVDALKREGLLVSVDR